MKFEGILIVASMALNAYVVHLALPTRKVLRRCVWTVLSLWTSLSLSNDAADMVHLFSWQPVAPWVRAGGVGWVFLSLALAASLALYGQVSRHTPARRAFFRSTAVAVTATPVVATAYAIKRAGQDAQVREVEIEVPNLAPDLDGLRIVQLSDIHLSPFYTVAQLRRAVDQANELSPSLAVVTGDLISSYGDPLEAGILELSRLRANAGIFGCHGNHEILAEVERQATELGARRGIHFLRSEAALLRFGNANLNLAGVDYQPRQHPYLNGVAGLRRSQDFNLLLSHNPDVFRVAAEQGWDLTLSGHTHGGQVTLEYLSPVLNPARFYTPFVYGDYRLGRHSLYVTSGLGTIGVPARFGTKPEIALIRLRALSPMS